MPASGLELLTQPDKLGTAAPTLKLQRDLTRLAHSLAQTRLKDSARDQNDVRVLECATDAFLPFLVSQTEHGLVISHADYISGLRLYLLLPQLLRMPTSTAPVLLLPPLLAPPTSPTRQTPVATAVAGTAIVISAMLMPRRLCQVL